MLDPLRAQGLDARIGFRIGSETFLARLAGSRIEVARDSLDRADVIFAGSAPAIAAAIYGGQPLGALAAAGALSIEGDPRLAERFVTLFPLPPKVEPNDRLGRPSKGAS
jgi:ubiquinone biosynthesis protein UbiJ